MSYRDWEDDPRNRRGRHSAPDGWVASDETYAGQPPRDAGRARGGISRYGDPAGGDPDDRAASGRRRTGSEPVSETRGWSVPDRLDDTGAWTRAAHTGEFLRPDEGWPARPAPDSTPPAEPAPEPWRRSGQRTTESWSGPAESPYGRGRAYEAGTYGRQALPSAETPAPAIPTSSGAYAGELLPPGQRRDAPGRFPPSISSISSTSAIPPVPAPPIPAAPASGYTGTRRRDPSPPDTHPTGSAYSGGSAHPGYPGGAAYPAEPATEPWSTGRSPGGYREDSGYRDDAPGYGAAPGYRDERGYRNEPGYREGRDYREESRSRERPGPGGTAGYRDGPDPRDRPSSYLDRTSPYAEQPPSYRDRPGRQRTGEPAYQDRPAWERAADPDESPYRSAPSYRDDPTGRDFPSGRDGTSYRDSSAYRAEPPYRDKPARLALPAQRALPAAPEPAYRNEPAYPDGPSYREGQSYGEGPDHRESPGYRDEPGPRERSGYGDSLERVGAGGAAYRAGVSDYRRQATAGRTETVSHPDAPSRRPAALPAQRRATVYDVDEDDEFDDEPEPGGYVASMVYTAMWYAVPLVLWVLWSLTLNPQASAGCVDDSGVPCASERTEALSTLTDALPRLGGTLLLSVLMALVLRWVSSSWRAGTVGFAAAVVGGGLATVAISVITGQPIG